MYVKIKCLFFLLPCTQCCLLIFQREASSFFFSKLLYVAHVESQCKRCIFLPTCLLCFVSVCLLSTFGALHFFFSPCHKSKPSSYTCSGCNYDNEVFFPPPPSCFLTEVSKHSYTGFFPHLQTFTFLILKDVTNTYGFNFLFLSVFLPLCCLFSGWVWAMLQSAYRPIK